MDDKLSKSRVKISQLKPISPNSIIYTSIESIYNGRVRILIWEDENV